MYVDINFCLSEIPFQVMVKAYSYSTNAFRPFGMANFRPCYHYLDAFISAQFKKSYTEISVFENRIPQEIILICNTN